MQCGPGTAGVVERLYDVGQVNQADGRDKITGADRPRYPFPVPPFERLQQRLAHGRAQPEPLGKIARYRQCDSMTCCTERPAVARNFPTSPIRRKPA
jgi:hypothetical protein